MVRKEFSETKKGLSSCGHHQQQYTMMNSCNSCQQQGTKKPPLPGKGPSAAASKIPSLKKISEIKRTSTRAFNLPVLDLDKVRRNFLEQAELASHGGNRGNCTEPLKVNSARYPSERNLTERKSFLLGSLTERGTRDVLVDRRAATSGTFTDRSCRQSYERKSLTSGSVTERSCRESFGSSYGLSLSNYLRKSRDSSLRSSKESPLVAPSMPKIKLDDRLNGNRFQSESRKSRGDKYAKYHSSISLTTYLPSTNHPLHGGLCSRNHHNDSTGHVSHVTRSNTKAEPGSWDPKRLPIQLVNTLEEALQGVNQPEFLLSEPRKVPCISSKPTQGLHAARSAKKLSVVKVSAQMDKIRAQSRDLNQSQEDFCLDVLGTSRRF